MERISVNASGKYDVVIGRGLIGDSAGLISPLLGSGRLAVITDDNVKNFCLGALKASLESAGIPYEVFVIPHGESSKNMTTLGTALEFLASHAFTRSDMIAALGGKDSTVDLAEVYKKRLRLIGSTLRSRSDEEKHGILTHIQEEILPYIVQGKFKPKLYAVLPLSDADGAHKIVEANQNIGKVILRVCE